MMKRIAVLPIILLFVTSFAAYAQDDTTLQYILDAVERLAMAESYHFEIVTSTKIVSENRGRSSEGASRTIYRGDVSGTDYQSTELYLQEDFVISRIVERIFVDDMFYIREINDKPPNPLSGLHGYQIPEEWILYEPYYGDDVTEMQKTLNRYFQDTPPLLLNEITTEAVIDAIELDSEIRSGIEMRVFDITLDRLQTSSGDNSEDATQDQDKEQFNIKLWIGVVDDRIYQMQVNIDAEGYEPDFYLHFISNGVYTISDYGEPVTIIAPDVAESESE